MTPAQLAALVRFKTRTNSTTFSDSDMLPLVNIFKDEIAGKIVDRNAGYFLIPETIDLADNQREYPLDADMLGRIQKMEIKFASGDSRFPAKWFKDYQGSETESEIVKNYSNSPGGFGYYIRRRDFLILSGTIVAVGAGIRYWFFQFPADLSNLTDTTDMSIDPTPTSFGLPRQFHELLARRVSIAYKSRQPKQVRRGKLLLTKEEQDYDRDLEMALQNLSNQDNSGEVIADFPASPDIFNDGYDL